MAHWHVLKGCCPFLQPHTFLRRVSHYRLPVVSALSTMVAADAWVLGDGFAPTAAYVALPVDEWSDAVCVDIGGMEVPTVGYTTPTADAVLCDLYSTYWYSVL